MKYLVLLVVATTLIFMSKNATAADIGIQGVYLGMAAEDAINTVKSNNGNCFRIACERIGEIKGHTVKINYMFTTVPSENAGSTLEKISIYFHPESFSAISTALSDKYGKPDSFRSIPLTNAFGVETSNEIATWEIEGKSIYTSKYKKTQDGYSTKEGFIMMLDKHLVSEMKDKIKAKQESPGF